METRLLKNGNDPGRRLWKKLLLMVGFVLLALLYLAAMPLPGPLSRARESWWKHSAERRARVEDYEAHGWPDDDAYTAAAGSIRFDGGGASVSLVPRSCDSGHLRMFYGVTVADPKQPGTSVRIVLPEGVSGHVTFSQQGHNDRVFEQQSCSLWDVAIAGTNSFYNRVQKLTGYARFDCTASGAHVVGVVTLRSCH